LHHKAARQERRRRRPKAADGDTARLAAESKAEAAAEAEAEAEALLPCELHDMHILRQVSEASLGGAVFDDHQDRHAETLREKKLRWTVTLLAHATGPPTGFFMWNARQRGPTSDPDGGVGAPFPASSSAPVVTGLFHEAPSGSDGTFEAATFPVAPTESDDIGDLRGVIPYEGAGSAVLFPSMAWHRSVIPAKEHWPFEALKFSFFFCRAHRPGPALREATFPYSIRR